jgi:hypothetical protein
MRFPVDSRSIETSMDRDVLCAAAAALIAPVFVAIVSAIWLVSGSFSQQTQPLRI